MRIPGWGLTAMALLPAVAAGGELEELSEEDAPPAAAAAPAGTAPKDCMDGIAAKPGKFCESVEDCMRFCPCACDFDSTKWKANVSNDGSTKCPRAPRTGEGMIPEDSADLRDMPAFQFVTARPGARATQAVVDGLTRLDERLAASAERRRLGFTVRVGNCYRSHEYDTERECGYVLKAMHMLARIPESETEKREKWLWKANPRNLGLAWPGNSPHSAGKACDLVLVDGSGQDCFDHRAGVPGSPRCSIDQRQASRLMDELATDPAVGARRLDYEAWHFEWGGPSGSRCVNPDCADSHWPPTGRPGR